MPAHLHSGPSQSHLGTKPSIPGRTRWLWKEATPEYCWHCTTALPHTSPTCLTHDTSHVGPQLNRAFEKVLLWWPEQEKGSGAPAASVFARKPSKNEKSKHGRIRKGRRNWHQVKGNLSISPTCASLHSSPSPRQTRSLVTTPFQLHVCYVCKRESSAELDEESCDLCDGACPDTDFCISLVTFLSNLSMLLTHWTNNS